MAFFFFKLLTLMQQRESSMLEWQLYNLRKTYKTHERNTLYCVWFKFSKAEKEGMIIVI